MTSVHLKETPVFNTSIVCEPLALGNHNTSNTKGTGTIFRVACLRQQVSLPRKSVELVS